MRRGGIGEGDDPKGTFADGCFEGWFGLRGRAEGAIGGARERALEKRCGPH